MSRTEFDRRAHPKAAVFADWRGPDGWVHRRMDWKQKGRGPRGSLLFAGGRGDFIEKYLESLAHWHGRGWNVTAFDWRGQGDSRGMIVGGHLDSLDILVDDLAALVRDLRTGSSGPHVAIGHSMGGHVLLRSLAERRVGLNAAVLVAPMLAINTAPLPNWAASSTASLMTAAGWRREPAWRSSPVPVGSSRQAYLTSCPDRYRDELWWWEKAPGFDLGAPSWGWLEAAYRSCAELTPEKLRSVQTPLLILGTETDRLVSAGAIRSAAAELPDVTLKMYGTAGHEILRESDPVRLDALAAIDSFLDRAAPR